MKKTLVALSLSLALAGCASMDEQSTAMVPVDVQSAVDQDELYVSYVEEVANRRGTRVVWVNAPTEDLTRDDEVPHDN